MQEITWKDRQRFTSEQVEAKKRQLGIPAEYPQDNDFTAEAIRKEIADLSDSYLWEDVVVMKGADYAPDVIIAFANLATKLHNQVTLQLGDMKIRRPTTDKQRREYALANLKSRLHSERNDRALRVLLLAEKN